MGLLKSIKEKIQDWLLFKELQSLSKIYRVDLSQAKIEYEFNEKKNPTALFIYIRHPLIKANPKTYAMFLAQMKMVGNKLGKAFVKEINKQSKYKIKEVEYRTAIVENGKITLIYEARLDNLS